MQKQSFEVLECPEGEPLGKGSEFIVGEVHFYQVDVGPDQVEFLQGRLTLSEDQHFHVCRVLHCLQSQHAFIGRCHRARLEEYNNSFISTDYNQVKTILRWAIG